MVTNNLSQRLPQYSFKKRSLYIHIAGFTIKVTFGKSGKKEIELATRNRIYRLCSGFISSTVKKKANSEIQFSTQKKPTKLIEINPLQFNIDYTTKIQAFELVLRKIVQRLLVQNGGFVLHASANCINRKAYVFTGNSGAGKTTISRLLEKKYPKFADDMLIIRPENSQYRVFQYPFLHKEKNIRILKHGAILCRIFFLSKARIERNKIVTYRRKLHILKRLLKQIRSSPNGVTNQIGELKKLVKTAHIFNLISFYRNREKLIETFGRLTK